MEDTSQNWVLYGEGGLTFADLKKRILPSNTFDDANNPLGSREDLFYQAVQRFEILGKEPNAIYCSYAMKKELNRSIGGDIKVDLSHYVLPSGATIPIISTFAIKDRNEGINKVSDLYFVVEESREGVVFSFSDISKQLVIQNIRIE